MADLLSWAGKQLQGAVSQINPFDGGADYNSVVNKKRKRPQQVVQRPQGSPQAIAPPSQPKRDNILGDTLSKVFQTTQTPAAPKLDKPKLAVDNQPEQLKPLSSPQVPAIQNNISKAGIAQRTNQFNKMNVDQQRARVEDLQRRSTNQNTSNPNAVADRLNASRVLGAIQQKGKQKQGHIGTFGADMWQGLTKPVLDSTVGKLSDTINQQGRTQDLNNLLRQGRINQQQYNTSLGNVYKNSIDRKLVNNNGNLQIQNKNALDFAKGFIDTGINKVGKDVVNGIVEAPKVIGTGAAHALDAANGNLDRRNQAYLRSNQQDINTIRTLGQKMRQTADPVERDRIRKSIGTISKLGDQEYQRNQLMNNQTIKAVDPVKNAAAIGQVGFDVATMGVGTGGVKAAKLAAKQGGKALARNLAVQGAKSGAIAAPSGALGAYVTNGQNTTASDVAKGAGAAFVLGGAIPAASYGVVKAAPIVARGARQVVNTAPKYTQQARTAIEQINPQVKELDSAYANMQRMFDNTSHAPSRQAYNKAMALNRQQRQALTEGGYFGLGKNSDIPPVQKSSRYASKTVPESEFVSQEVGKKAKQNAPLYNVETEKQRYTSALMGLKKNGEENFENSVRERLSSKAGTIESQDVADAQTLAQLLDARGDKVSLQKASEIYDKLSEHLTAAGQTVQAASILSRRSPQGMSYWANKQLKDAGIKSTPELQLQIKTIADKARKATTQAEKDQAAFELAKTVSDNIPSSTKDRVVNAWRAGLLTAPTTTGGNILGNSSEAFTRKFLVNPTAIAADKAMGLFTGKRAMALSPSGTAAEGMKEGSSKLGKYIKTGFDERNVARSVTGELGKYENKADINYGKSKLGNLMGDYVNKTYRLMGTADMPFWYSARRESLGSIANAEAINQGLKGQDKFKFIKEFMDNPPEAAMQRATDEANDATFQNKTALGSAASGLKRPLGAVGDFVIPFTQVPASIATRIITRTPIGTASEMLKQIMKVRNGGSFDQRKMAQAIGEGSVGTGILGSGYALANSGMMTFGLPEDQKERKLWEMEGKQPYSVKVGDRWYSLNYMQPFGTLLAIGGKMAEGAKEGKDITETLAAGIATGGQALMNQSFLKGVSGVLDAIDDPKRYAENWAENTAGSAIPNFVRSLARSSDTNQRNTGNDIGNALKGGIPGLRQTVPEKLDAFGRPLPAKDNFLNQFLNPLKPSIARENDPVVAELRRLLESKNGVLPSSADKASIKGKDGKSALTNSQIQELNKIVGSKQYDHYRSIMNDPRYADLEDEDKARKLKGINKTLFGAEKTKYGYENSLYGDDKVSKLNTKQRQYLKNDSVDFLSSTSSRESYADKYDRLSKDYSSNKDSYTPIERIKKEKELSRLSVQKDFTNDVVSLYNMSKGDVYNYISTNSDGQKMAEDLVKYGDAMVEAGLYKYNKFKNGFGTGSVAKGGRKGGKRSGRKGGGKGSKSTGVASLNAILKASRAVKAPKAPKVAKAKTPKMGKMSLAKYKPTKKVSQRKAAIPAPKKPKFV